MTPETRETLHKIWDHDALRRGAKPSMTDTGFPPGVVITQDLLDAMVSEEADIEWMIYHGWGPERIERELAVLRGTATRPHHLHHSYDSYERCEQYELHRPQGPSGDFLGRLVFGIVVVLLVLWVVL